MAKQRISANQVSVGTAGNGSVLSSNGTVAYWSNSISPNLISISTSVNGAILTSNGTSTYWANSISLGNTTVNTSLTSNYLYINGKQAVNGPVFSVYANNSATSITSGSQQVVTFNNKDFDTANCYNATSSSTSQNGLTVPAWSFCPNVPGYYQINSAVRLNGAVGTGEQMITVWKNGSEYKRGWNANGVSWATGWWSMSVSTLVYLNGTGDYVNIYIQQGSGSTETITGGSSISYFNGSMIRGG